MNLNEPPDITPDRVSIQQHLDEKSAVARGELWERLDCPQSKLHMPIDEYMKSFRGRHWFVSRTVFEQAQMALRIIICPKCIKDVPHGGVEGTQFYTTVEDDVMTVFPAVGHFLCHWCGFEEYHPLKHDPRVKRFDANEDVFDQKTRRFMNQSASALGGQGNSMYGSAGMANQLGQGIAAQQAKQAQIEAIQQAYANGMMPVGDATKAMAKLVEGINPGMGPIWGMTEAERQSLHRLYQQTQNKQSPPPKIVHSKEEAEMLVRLAPIERRQAIIQKLRDLGKI